MLRMLLALRPLAIRFAESASRASNKVENLRYFPGLQRAARRAHCRCTLRVSAPVELCFRIEAAARPQRIAFQKGPGCDIHERT